MRTLTAGEIDSYVESRGCGSYQRKLLELIAKEPYPEEETYAIDLLVFLDRYDLRIDEYCTNEDGESGSIYGNAHIVACAFSGISSDDRWWIQKYRSSPQSKDAGKFWYDRFSARDGVVVF